ncbi:MAG: VWA domain-containing protein [Planctomycetaceae bacterium]|nr:VWA domain-containing protein [Planctomycetaceae bacterium]
MHCRIRISSTGFAHHAVSRRQGAIVVMVAILLPMLLILAAYAVNSAWMELSRTQAVIAADSATRAAGRTYSLTGDVAQARTRANQAAALNPVAGKPMTISNSDFVVGTSARSGSTGRYNFTAGGSNPNALRVSIRNLSSNANGEIKFLLPGILGPSGYEVSKTAVSTRVEVDLAFVVDRSGSMAYASNEKAVYPPIPKAAPAGWFFDDPAPNPSRWRDLVSATDTFIAEMNKSVLSEYVALVTYGDKANVECNPTSNYSQIRNGIDKYTKSFPSGKTNIGAGLNQAVNVLGGASGRPFASKVIVLMTDGIRTPGLGPNPVSVASAAAKDGIITFTITFSNEADQTEMKKVAAAGNGQHFHAVDAASLKAVLQNIIRILPTVITE